MTQVLNLSDRNLMVRGMTKDRVIYDVIFKKNDATDLKQLEAMGMSADTMRNRNPFQSAPLDQFAVRVAQQGGIYLRSDDKAIQSVIDGALKAHFG
jgi:hypothetical protein